MRYVILGAGAIGGTIGYRLHTAGRDVVLIARGDHLEALQTSGLIARTPRGTDVLRAPAVVSPADAEIREEDVVVLATKTQDSPAALDALASAASSTTAVVCAQNSVENERLALRYFENVYGMCVIVPAGHVEPGVIECYGSPHFGVLDVGRYPTGVDTRAYRVADDLERAGFRSRADDRIMRMKYFKLVTNVHNAVEALAGPRAKASHVTERGREEALRVLEAAGIEVASAGEDRARREGLRFVSVAEGSDSPLGSSSWQSLARKLGSIETDYLNGEIVLLGRLHGVPTPVNLVIQQQARRFAEENREPGSMSLDELTALVDAEVLASTG